MTSRSESLIGELQGLQQGIAEFRRNACELAQALQAGDFARNVRATQNARRALSAIGDATMVIRPQVIHADYLGATLDSLAELALRAVQLVIAMEVSTLGADLRGAAALDRARALSGSRFRNFEDLAWFVHDQFQRINRQWMPYRRGAPVSESRVLYREAIRAAQRSVRELGDDPGLAHFLRQGVALSDWSYVHQACTRTSISINIEAEPDRLLFMHSQPLHCPDVAAARKP